ncbi:MAG: hypothetical protein H5T86_10250 [Armatimonadetes bacterium]|nr:hypothetical protein [Armatimonadota bacterium]
MRHLARFEDWLYVFGRRAVARPGAVVWLVALGASLPGVTHLLTDFAYDPDMCHVAPTFLRMQPSQLPQIFTRPAPWGDGSYRPFVFLAWWLAGRVFGWWAPGWALICWAMGVVCAALLGLLVLEMSGSPSAAVVASALAGLHQVGAFPFSSRLASNAALALVLLSAAYLVLPRWHPRRRSLTLIAAWISLGFTVFCTEWPDESWVPWYVGGQTAVQGTMLHLLLAYLGWQYARHNRRWRVVAFWLAWALMAWSYEQPQTLVVAAAPAFLLTVPRRRRLSAVPLVAGAAALTCCYAAIRLYFLRLYGPSPYQIMQLRSSSVWLYDMLAYMFPPASLYMTAAAYTGFWGFLFNRAHWISIGRAVGWLWAYLLPLQKQPLVGALLWWKLLAYLPLARFHQHSHYRYLPGLVTTGCHGLLTDFWVEQTAQQARQVASSSDKRGHFDTARSCR